MASAVNLFVALYFRANLHGQPVVAKGLFSRQNPRDY